MDWKIGDKAIIVADNPVCHGGAVGCYCTIESLPDQYGRRTHASIIVDGYPSQNTYPTWSINVKYLRPIPDDKTDYSRFHADLIPCESGYEWDKEVVV